VCRWARRAAARLPQTAAREGVAGVSAVARDAR
jgi:hypothetical protein